jgi:hypothetical protein
VDAVSLQKKISDLALRQVGLARRRRAMLSASARAVADVLQEVIGAKGPKQRGVRVRPPPDNAVPSNDDQSSLPQ